MRTTIRTSGIVLSSEPHRERGRLVWILTDALGLVPTRADGVLSHTSKLSPSLTTMSYGSFTLVRGAYEWRVRGALSEGNAFYDLKGDEEKWRVFKNICGFLRKALHGEEHVSCFYDEVMALKCALEEPFTPPSYARLLGEARLLAHLGFADIRDIPASSYDADALRALASSKKDIEALILRGKEAAQFHELRP